MELGLIEQHLRPDYYKKQLCLQKSHIGLSPQVYFSLAPHIDVNRINFRTIT
jgi:hypothetical protein